MIRRAVLALALLAAPAPATARSHTTVAYDAPAVFAATIRFIRVDLDAKLLDKDPDAGYAVFEYVDDGKAYRSSFEVVTVERDGRRTVTITLDIRDRPDYLEVVLLDKLRARLRADLGDEPRPAPRPAPPKPAPPKEPPPEAPPSTDGGK